MPPEPTTDNSVVAAPKSTISIPFVFRTSIPIPIHCATPRSTILTSFAFAVEWTTRSKNARFSTSVTSVGTAIRYSDPLVKRRSFFSRFWRRYCISVNLLITPSFIGNTPSIFPGVLSNIAYASSPTAKISFPSTIAITFFSFHLLSCFLSYTLIS